MLDGYNAVQLVSQARLRLNELRPKNEIIWMGITISTNED